MELRLARLGEVDPADIVALMSHPSVRRHMPLAADDFGLAECAAFVAAKEALWRDHGYGPWAFLVDGEFAGWGGLQPEGDDADLALVLHRRFWGHGRAVYERMLDEAFGTFGLDSVTVLLPPTRGGAHGLARLGFRPDGEADIEGRRFLRYRLLASRRGLIFHIAEAADWERAQAAGDYRVSSRGRTLAEEGFIHAARREQVLGVAERYYADAGPLLLLTIDPARLSSPVRDDEIAPGVVFPHIYGPLNLEAVVAVAPLVREGSGFVLSD